MDRTIPMLLIGLVFGGGLGFVVAAALRSVGYTRGFSVLLGMLSGLVEPLGAVIGASIIGSSALLLPWGLGFAAGAMLFVISHEIIPESHRQGHELHATTGLMLGFVLMMVSYGAPLRYSIIAQWGLVWDLILSNNIMHYDDGLF